MDGEQTEQTGTALEVIPPEAAPQEEKKALRPVTDEEAWEAIANTRYYAPMDRIKFEAKAMFGQYLTARLSTEILLVNVFETLELLQENVRVATQTAQDENVPADVRVKSIMASASAASSLSDMTRQVEEMIERTKPQAPTKRKNLPPPGAQNLILAQNVTFPSTDSDKNGK